MPPDKIGTRAQDTLGIDIGRVIIGPTGHTGHVDTAFLSGTPEQALQTPPAPAAFVAIAQLVTAFSGKV